jgi:hypothetical protein
MPAAKDARSSGIALDVVAMMWRRTPGGQRWQIRQEAWRPSGSGHLVFHCSRLIR